MGSEFNCLACRTIWVIAGSRNLVWSSYNVNSLLFLGTISTGLEYPKLFTCLTAPSHLKSVPNLPLDNVSNHWCEARKQTIIFTLQWGHLCAKYRLFVQQLVEVKKWPKLHITGLLWVQTTSEQVSFPHKGPVFQKAFSCNHLIMIWGWFSSLGGLISNEELAVWSGRAYRLLFWWISC